MASINIAKVIEYIPVTKNGVVINGQQTTDNGLVETVNQLRKKLH